MRAGKTAALLMGPMPQGLLTSDPAQTGSAISVGPGREEKECRDESKANTPPASQASLHPLPESGLFSAEKWGMWDVVGVGGYSMGPMQGSQFPCSDLIQRQWQGKVSAVVTWCPFSFTSSHPAALKAEASPSPTASSILIAGLSPFISP